MKSLLRKDGDIENLQSRYVAESGVELRTSLANRFLYLECLFY